MRGSATMFVLCSAVWMCACQPYYRDDELRALRAEDTRQGAQLWTEGERALAAGHAPRAERLFGQALQRSSPRDASMYLRLARAQQAAGSRVLARATARFALTLPSLRSAAGSDGPDALRRFLLQSYGEDRLIGCALEWASPATVESAAMQPALRDALAPLADAERLAPTQPAQALARYAAWLSAYGEPDHPLLRASRARILNAVSPLTLRWSEQAAQLDRSGAHAEAIRRYALAYRYQTDARFAAITDDFVRACAAVAHPESLSPLASSEARSGDGALSRDDLATALFHYRRAVAAAPCWALAHRHLALLLAQVELHAEAVRQLDWALRLAPATMGETAEADRTLRRTWARAAAEPHRPDARY